MRGLRGSLAARLVGLFSIGTMLVFALLGASLVLMLRGELRARDIEEIDSKTKAVEHHLAEVHTARELERSLSRFVDTEVGHTYVRLGVWLDGRWLLAPAGPLATLTSAAGAAFRMPSRIETTAMPLPEYPPSLGAAAGAPMTAMDWMFFRNGRIPFAFFRSTRVFSAALRARVRCAAQSLRRAASFGSA